MSRPSKKGFTFMEVLIVLGVFSIGVMAVLRLIVHNMSSVSVLETKTIATFLAKEGMDLTYNLRDANLLQGRSWNCLPSYDIYKQSEQVKDVCNSYFLSGKYLLLGLDDSRYTSWKWYQGNDDFLDIYSGARLFLGTDYSSGVRYTYYGNEPSIFARYISFTGVVDGENILPKDRVLKIVSRVLYVKGARTGEVVLEGFIANY